MPQCTIPFDQADGATVEVTVSKAKSITNREAEINESRRTLFFLLDSGASKTAINPEIAKNMGLLSIGQRLLKSVANDVTVNLFMIDLGCGLFDPPLLLPDLEIMELPNKSLSRDGILGRDFLEKIVCEIDGPRRLVKISF